MSLFRKLAGLFGGTAERPVANGSNDSSRGDGSKSGGHGTHWDALVTDEEEIVTALNAAVENGEPVDGTSADGTPVSGYVDRSGGCGSCAVGADGQLITGYPDLEGVTHEVLLEDVVEWNNGAEAQLRGSLGPASVGLFDTRYFTGPAYEPESQYEVSIAGLAYSFERAAAETVTDAEGNELSTAGMAAFAPFEDGDIDDYSFQTTVKEVATTAFDGRTDHRLRVPLFRLDEETDVDISLYVAEHVAGGYEPSVGDDVRGVLWLQGRVV